MEGSTPKIDFLMFSSATSGENAFLSYYSVVACYPCSLPYQMNWLMHQPSCVSNAESQWWRQNDVTSTFFELFSVL